MSVKHRIFAAVLAVSAAGVGMIATHEGKVNKTYADPAHGWAVPTVCYGHTSTATRGRWYSDEQCLDLLEKDVAQAYGHLRRLAPVPLTQGETDAYTSFLFNAGPGNFEKSTMRRKLLAGDRVGACREFGRWVYAGGKKLKGLVTRRAEEQALCLRDL